ncbi:hypothetical protein FA13DRAFT_1723076 [Coprinellus micaceus]|uniref:Uncharacterized protein n=1 Tax=Coprinellus micaceus TaxID=71717 RepID=A0A4Y7RBP2_COPMI|nr:hypothetical protein FA13DRAFT_1723076 [Coprinellus micaceus]
MPPQSKPTNHITSFFDAYPSFTFNPTAPSSASEFRRLCQDSGSTATDAEKRESVAEVLFDVEDRARTGGPERCERVLKIHVNPVDLIEGFKGSKEIKTFENEADLAEYSTKNREAHLDIDSRRRIPKALRAQRLGKKENADQKVAWRDFQDALARQFNSLYGVDVDNLKLLAARVFDVEDRASPSKPGGRHRNFKTHFNLVDLIEGYKGAREIKTFESDVELAEYSPSWEDHLRIESCSWGASTGPHSTFGKRAFQPTNEASPVGSERSEPRQGRKRREGLE